MDVSIFGAIVCALGLVAFVTPFQWAVVFMACCTLFGATEAISIGGTGILPGNLFLLFFAARAFMRENPSAILSSLTPKSPAVWLFLLVMLGCTSALVLPHILQGDTSVFAIDRSSTDVGRLMTTPLGPVSGNQSQSVYLIGELVLYVTVSIYMRKRSASLVFANAMLLLCALNILAALVDLVAADQLALIKTAQYAIFDDTDVGGMHRISGTFSETSAFSGFSLPLLAFSLNLWLLGYRKVVSGTMALTTFCLLAMSTSSTAYAGLGIYLCVFAVSRSRHIDAHSGRKKLQLVAFATIMLAVLIAFLIAIDSPIVKAVADFLNGALFEKLDSDSGVERSAWNMQSLVNLIDTNGLGTGLGSSRASSFPLVLLGNLGIAGFVVFVCFLFRTSSVNHSSGVTRGDAIVGYAAKQAMIANLVGATISAAVFDLGPCFYIFCAITYGAMNRPAAIGNRWFHCLQSTVRTATSDDGAVTRGRSRQELR